jgi:hypothetical protein
MNSPHVKPVVAKYRRKFQADFRTINYKLLYLNFIMLLDRGWQKKKSVFALSAELLQLTKSVSSGDKIKVKKNLRIEY